MYVIMLLCYCEYRVPKPTFCLKSHEYYLIKTELCLICNKNKNNYKSRLLHIYYSEDFATCYYSGYMFYNAFCNQFLIVIIIEK